METVPLSLTAAERLPESVGRAVQGIAEDASQAAYALIADRLKGLGYPVSGDIFPHELLSLEDAFRLMVRSMALNNPLISDLNHD